MTMLLGMHPLSYQIMTVGDNIVFDHVNIVLMSVSFAVVKLELNESMSITEGEMYEICVTVSNDSHKRERNIHVSFSISPNSNTSGNPIEHA